MEIRIKGKKGDYYIQFLNENRRWENLMIQLPIGLYHQLTYRTKKEAIRNLTCNSSVIIL